MKEKTIEFHHKKTKDGFESVYFKDELGEECFLIQSKWVGDYEDAKDNPGSAAVWLGKDEDEKMHLDRARVRMLIFQLQRWLNTNSFLPQ